MNRIFIQIGAGAGDQDSRHAFRDGFSELIKKTNISPTDRIILVEPNPLNIKLLEKCWENYPQAEIYQIGIVPKSLSGNDLPFYYTELDAPCYQSASFSRNHVLRSYTHLKAEDLTELKIKTIDLESFILNVTQGKEIEILCLDIEGLDADVILDTNFKLLNIRGLSIEYLHLGSKTHQVVNHLFYYGFKHVGLGVDHNRNDWFFIRST